MVSQSELSEHDLPFRKGRELRLKQLVGADHDEVGASDLMTHITCVSKKSVIEDSTRNIDIPN